MPQHEAQGTKNWFDEAIRHLTQLCEEAHKLADEGDVLPSRKGFVAATQIMDTFRQAPVPRIGVTCNGEISLMWENTGDEFRAYAKPDGSTQFYRNKQQVDEESFSALARVPA